MSYPFLRFSVFNHVIAMWLVALEVLISLSIRGHRQREFIAQVFINPIDLMQGREKTVGLVAFLESAVYSSPRALS